MQQVQQALDETASLVSAGPSASQVSASPSAATTQVKGGVRSVVEGSNARLLHVAERPAQASGILALCDQPGWHDKHKPCHKVYVVCGKSQQVRRKVTPGPRHKVFALRSTWQFDDQLQAWKRIEHKVEWQRLADPHERFAGGKVRAIMLFEPAPGAASVARVGDLLVDTGACASVCRPDTFQAEVGPSTVEALFSVDDSPLSTRGGPPSSHDRKRAAPPRRTGLVSGG